jgi:transcriptional regulator with XRE-family HTH domain
MIVIISYDLFEVNMVFPKGTQITGSQIRAARALIRWSAEDLARKSRLGVATIRRAEAEDTALSITAANADAIQRALEAGGIVFVPENGGGVGVRLNQPTVHRPR